MICTIISKDADMLVLRPANDPANVVMVYRSDDPQFAQRKVGDVVELLEGS